MSHPRVWIVIPSFNSAGVTRKCLTDLSRQTYRNITMVLSDSGSTDGTREIVRKEFPRVIIINGNPDWWWTKATNEGIKHALQHAASDDYIMTLNNDVAVPDTYVAEMAKLAEKYPRSIIGSAIFDANDPGRLVECGTYIEWNTMKYHFLSLHELDGSGFCEKLTFLCGKGVLYPAAVFQEHGLFDEAGLPHYGADLDFVALCKKRGYSIRVQTQTPLFSREEITAAGVRDVKTLREKFMLLFIRKSKLNLAVHMRLMLRHCPRRYWPRSAVFLTGRLLGHIFVTNGAQRAPTLKSGAKVRTQGGLPDRRRRGRTTSNG